jgi:lysophospholipase L1-like esterase
LGFGHLPVFVEDPDYEYIFAPDQDFHRLGHHFYTNHFSMRSDALSTNDSIRILVFGDSILNGGSSTDNDELATSILEKNLSAKLRKKVRVLNISAGSWGPDNAAAYLKKHGDFGAKMIVLVFSSHDYFDNMGFEKEVGFNSAYPAKNPSLAIADFVINYLFPVFKHYFFTADPSRNDSMYYLNSKQMNAGWDDFIRHSRKNKIPLLVYVHGEKQEASQGHYNQYGRWIAEYLQDYQVPYILDVSLRPDPKLFRDFIHFNKDGQRFMANALEPEILKTLKTHP